MIFLYLEYRVLYACICNSLVQQKICGQSKNKLCHFSHKCFNSFSDYSFNAATKINNHLHTNAHCKYLFVAFNSV